MQPPSPPPPHHPPAQITHETRGYNSRTTTSSNSSFYMYSSSLTPRGKLAPRPGKRVPRQPFLVFVDLARTCQNRHITQHGITPSPSPPSPHPSPAKAAPHSLRNEGAAIVEPAPRLRRSFANRDRNENTSRRHRGHPEHSQGGQARFSRQRRLRRRFRCRLGRRYLSGLWGNRW